MKLDTYKAITQFHENDKLITWLQNQPLIDWLTPKRRRLALLIGALFAGVGHLVSRYARLQDDLPTTTWLIPSMTLLILLGFVYLVYLIASHYRRLPAIFRHRPQLYLHFIFWAILAAIWLTPDYAGIGKSIIMLMAASFPYMIWRCGYILLSGQRGHAARTIFRDHLFYIWPVWGGTNTPAGKGHDYLSRREARSREAYARSFLAGLKLLILALVWKLVLLVMGGAVYADPKSPLTAFLGAYSLDVPQIKYILRGDVTAPLFLTWISLYLDLLRRTLILAAKGHVWVGILRLFGFNVFRNTYKPLFAVSILDFWSRYYFYFKELLVEFFFYPTFLHYFRTQPRLRIIVAVFAAAFVGNMYYHLIQLKYPLIDGNFSYLWRRLEPRFVYCFLLAAGISISMLRQKRQRGTAPEAGATAGSVARLRKIAGVWTFYGVINLWSIKVNATLTQRTQFFFSLFGF